MPGYNDEFRLNVQDLDIIESAIRDKLALLSSNNLSEESASCMETERTIKDLSEVLGKLSNQKRWYSQVNLKGVPSG